MKARAALLIGMIVVGALSRVIVHPPNFTPIAALALFGAANFRQKWIGFVVPLAAMFLGDLALEGLIRLGWLGGWMAQGSGFYTGMWIVYAAYLLTAALGLLLRRKQSIALVAGTTLTASVVYFLVTNFAWWSVYDLYPHTGAGLIASYEMAIPFFRCSLLGDLTFATVFFGGFALVQKMYPSLQLRTA